MANPNPNFTPHPPEVRERAAKLHAEGQTPRQIAATLGTEGVKITDNTIRGWLKKDGDPEKVSPPPIVENKTTSAGGKTTTKRNVAKGLLGSDKCSEIVGGAFDLFALFAGGGWALTPTERKALGESLSNMSGMLPRWARDAIDTWSSPAIFAGQFGAVVSNRLQRIAELEAYAAQEYAARRDPHTAPIAPPGGVQPERPAPIGVAPPPRPIAPPKVVVPPPTGPQPRLRDLIAPNGVVVPDLRPHGQQ